MSFDTLEALEERLSRPDELVKADLASLDGDVMVVGATGKMGPTLARMAKRALPRRKVWAIARYTDGHWENRFREQEILPVKADLLDQTSLAKLPDAPNVVVMTGFKFGATANPSHTWTVNSLLPARLAERLTGRRLVVFSTGCVYPFVSTTSGGATEDAPLTPLGEYANSCVGRERLVAWQTDGSNTPALFFRLNYAIDCRYGVLHDIATKVRSGLSVDLETSHVNVIWQGDANAMALRSLRHCAVPAAALNVTGPETIPVRWIAQWFGNRFKVPPIFSGQESSTAWLSNAAKAHALFGYPTVSLAEMMEWVADWVDRSMPSLNKPTGFEVRSGTY